MTEIYVNKATCDSAGKPVKGPSRQPPDDSRRPVVQTAPNPSSLFDNKVEDGAQYEIFKLEDENIYYLDFASMGIQGQAFNRVSAFIESKSFAGKVLNNDELEEVLPFHRYEIVGIGHDYKISDLCRFYNAAEAKKVKLNDIEVKIKTDLTDLGLIEKTKEGYTAKSEAAIISSSPEVGDEYGNEWRGETILHEYRHGLFYSDQDVRDEINSIWQNSGLSPREKGAVSQIVAKVGGWDENNEQMILNELYAGIMDRTMGLVSMTDGIGGPLDKPAAIEMNNIYEQFVYMEIHRQRNRGMKTIYEQLQPTLMAQLKERKSIGTDTIQSVLGSDIFAKIISQDILRMKTSA